MKVTLSNGKEVIVFFNYLRDDKQGTRITRAFMKDPVTERVILEGSARQNPLDHDERRTGRKLALTRMLTPLSKVDRAQVWDVYCQTTSV